MITVNNEYEVESTTAGEIDPGTAFVGTINDINEEERNGVFLRTATGLILVDDPSVEFETFDEGDVTYSPKVNGFREVDLDVTVTDVY